MNILHISIAYPKQGFSNLYSDLDEALAKNGHKVCVAVADSSVEPQQNTVQDINGVEVFRVRTRRIFSVGLVRKALAFLELPRVMKRAIRKNFGSRHFDLILFEAPPVTLWSVVRWAKKHFSAPAYLMQKDIFPQNAVDLKMFSKKSPPYLYFRRQERCMFKTADAIGCMSEGNMRYIIEHNRYIPAEKVRLFPNTEKVSASAPSEERKLAAKANLAKRFSIPCEACIFIFGGNMGRPQDIPFICRALELLNGYEKAYFLCIGTGNEAEKLKNFIAEKKISNAKYLAKVPREEYIEITCGCDVGLVVLNADFTIPNYPSKTLGYMQNALPILAATDKNTDYKDLIQTQAVCGKWCHSASPEAFVAAVKELAGDKELREKLGNNGRRYLEENFEVSRSVKLLEDFIAQREKNA